MEAYGVLVFIYRRTVKYVEMKVTVVENLIFILFLIF